MHIKIDDDYRMEYHTDLKPVIHVIKEYIESLDWLISNHEFRYLNNGGYDNRLNPNENLIRISGRDLCEIISQNQLQFIWGILSGCKQLPQIEHLDFEKLNLRNYDAEINVYDDAEIEIDCFDS